MCFQMKIVKDVTEKFDSLGLIYKIWSFFCSNPPEEVTEEIKTGEMAGVVCCPKFDWLEIPLLQLHFSNLSQGRLVARSRVFDKSMEIVPKCLTPELILSKNLSIFDLPGKIFLPLLCHNADVSKLIKELKKWNN